MNRRLRLRVLGAVMPFIVVLAALYFGGVFAQVELAVGSRRAQPASSGSASGSARCRE